MPVFVNRRFILNTGKRGKNKIDTKIEKLARRGKITGSSAAQILSKIQTGVKEKLCLGCDLVIETALEAMNIKKETFKVLDEIRNTIRLPA